MSVCESCGGEDGDAICEPARRKELKAMGDDSLLDLAIGYQHDFDRKTVRGVTAQRKWTRNEAIEAILAGEFEESV